MTRTEFLAGMTYLSAAVGKPTPPEQMEVYFDLLGKLPFDLFQSACKRALLGLSDNFLPAAGAIHRHACDIALKLRSEQEMSSRRLHDARIKGLLEGIGDMPALPRQRTAAEVRRLLNDRLKGFRGKDER